MGLVWPTNISPVKFDKMGFLCKNITQFYIGIYKSIKVKHFVKQKQKMAHTQMIKRNLYSIFLNTQVLDGNLRRIDSII